jgi:hypothetical protein
LYFVWCYLFKRMPHAVHQALSHVLPIGSLRGCLSWDQAKHPRTLLPSSVAPSVSVPTWVCPCLRGAVLCSGLNGSTPFDIWPRSLAETVGNQLDPCSLTGQQI